MSIKNNYEEEMNMFAQTSRNMTSRKTGSSFYLFTLFAKKGANSESTYSQISMLEIADSDD